MHVRRASHVGARPLNCGVRRHMRKLPLKVPSERLWAFSLPERGTMFVVDYDEVHRISLKPVPSVETLNDNPYEFAKTIQDFGVSDRAPVLQAGGFNVSYTFDPKADTQSVRVESSVRS